MGDLGRSGAIWGDLGRSGEIWGDLGRSGEIWGDPGRSGEIWGDLACMACTSAASMVALPLAGKT